MIKGGFDHDQPFAAWLSALRDLPGQDATADGPGYWRFDSWDGYSVRVREADGCGVTQEGDGPVLTLLLAQLAASSGHVRLTSFRERVQADGGAWYQTWWTAKVRLGRVPGLVALSDADCEALEAAWGRVGRATGRSPGLTVLVAYLRAHQPTPETSGA